MKEDEIIVITARCIDNVAHFDDIDKTQCEICGEMTWLSSSWRGRKIDKIICSHCFKNGKYQDEDSSTNITEACLNDAAKFMKKRYKLKNTDKEIKEKMIKVVEKNLGEKINVIK